MTRRSAEGKVKHCRITQEGRIFQIGGLEFENLVKLVEHYEKRPLYRKMKLRYPIDAETVKKYRDAPEVDDFYLSDQLYHDPNSDKGKEPKTTGVWVW